MLVQLSQLAIGGVDLGAAFLFMFGLKQMSSPATAPGGIRLAGLGMAAAVLVSFLYVFTVEAAARPHLMINIALAVVALGIGGAGAWFVGRKVAMTAMPQMVAIYNGMGGGAAGSIAAVELFGGRTQGVTQLIVTLLGGLIGAVSLSGSVIAWAKLDGVLKNPLRFKGQQVVNAAALLASVAVAGVILASVLGVGGLLLPTATWIWIFFAFAIVFGILMTLPIGGADMPVVISIYNAFTGLAVGLEGFVLQNPALMIAGMVVGAAGLLLTVIMAKAMNRSIANVRHQGQRTADRSVRRRHQDALCLERHHRTRLRPRGRPRPAEAL
jgi:NAD(P) transhydrogenase subunit beta